jgi:2-aminoadipate transaminase
MPFDLSSHLRPGLPNPAAAPFKGFAPYYFVGGNNAREAVKVADLVAAATRALEKEGPNLAIYNLQTGPQGYRPLREWLVGRLKSWCDMDVTPDNILVTSGSLQALDLVHKALLEPGDVVVVEGGTYGGTMTRLLDEKAEYVGVAMDDDGIIPAELEKVLGEIKAAGKCCKYVYTIPTVQNPTGTVMSLERRHALLDMAKKHDIMIFEDDCYADLTWSGTRPPAIYSLDTEGRVIYCGTFSKTIGPALRVGYLVADWPFIAQSLPLKTDAGTGALEQVTLAEYCPAHFEDHVTQLTALFKQKCDAIEEALAENFGAAAEFRSPEGGIFIWVTLPDVVDTTKLAQVAAAAGIAINPGREWVSDPETGKHSFRLCFGQPSIEDIKVGVAKLAEVCHEEFGVPITSGNVQRS